MNMYKGSQGHTSYILSKIKCFDLSQLTQGKIFHSENTLKVLHTELNLTLEYVLVRECNQGFLGI